MVQELYKNLKKNEKTKTSFESRFIYFLWNI